MFSKIELGKAGELAAIKFLRWHKRYKIIATNYRTRWGEIDIICRKHRRLFFVEVKTRTSEHFGYPELAITPAKAAHIVAAAECYRLAHPDIQMMPWQIDAIAITMDQQKKLHITHIPNCIHDIE